MNDQDATRLLAKLAEGVPVNPAPVNGVVERGRRTLRKRRLIQVLSTCAAVVALAVTGFALRPGFGGGATVADPSVGHALDTAPGTHLVGFQGVAVAVPDDWRTGKDPDPNCRRLDHGVVVFPSGVVPQLTPSCDALNSTLHFVPLDHDGIANQIEDTHRVADVDGAEVYATNIRPQSRCNGTPCTSVFNQAFTVPSKRVLLFVNSFHKSQIRQILGSLRIIPDGYTAVPDFTGQIDDKATDLAQQSGLKWRTDCPAAHTCRLGRIVATDPPAGSVVLTGTTVTQQKENDRAPADATSTCPTDDLVIALKRSGGAWHGMATELIAMKNSGGTACLLHGADLNVVVERPNDVSANVDMTAVTNMVSELQPGKSASLLMGAPASCSGNGAVATELDVTVQGGQATHLNGAHVPLICGPPRAIELTGASASLLGSSDVPNQNAEHVAFSSDGSVAAWLEESGTLPLLVVYDVTNSRELAREDLGVNDVADRPHLTATSSAVFYRSSPTPVVMRYRWEIDTYPQVFKLVDPVGDNPWRGNIAANSMCDPVGPVVRRLGARGISAGVKHEKGEQPDNIVTNMRRRGSSTDVTLFVGGTNTSCS